MDKVQKSLEVNNLLYKAPVDISVAENRTIKRNYFQSRSYANVNSSTTLVCDLNTGTSYVNGPDTCLYFTVRNNGANEIDFGSNFAVSLFNALRIRTRSGTELERIDNINYFALYDTVYRYPEDWRLNYGQQLGFGTKIQPTFLARFCIPMKLLTKLFDPEGDVLLNSSIASGLHIELSCENPARAVISATTAIYNIEDIHIGVCCTDLNDSSQIVLNKKSATTGLDTLYKRVYTYPIDNTVQSNSIELKKAVSNACYVFAVIVDEARSVNQGQDSFDANNWNVSRFIYRIGNLYFPNNGIGNSGEEPSLTAIPAYQHAQTTFNKNASFFRESGISFNDFVLNRGIMAASFERDQSLQLSGIPLNSSRLCQLDFELKTAPGNPQKIFMFLVYNALAKAFIDNTSLKI